MNQLLVPRSNLTSCDSVKLVNNKSPEKPEIALSDEKKTIEKSEDKILIKEQDVAQTKEEHEVQNDQKSTAEFQKHVQKQNLKNSIMHARVRRKGSLTSECSSSTEVDTPKHFKRLSSTLR